jgi:TRAP-type C4-dicarboxylate transport system permease small subunit
MTRDATPAARKIRALQRAVRWMTALLVGTLLLTLTGVTLVDVIGRYAFAQPLNGASEITELLVMAIVFAGLPAICLDDAHITVDLFTSALKGRAAAIQVFVARLFVSGVLGLVAWQLWAHGERLGSYGQTTLYLHAPLEPIAKAAAGIAGVSALLTLAMAATWIPKRDSEGL